MEDILTLAALWGIGLIIILTAVYLVSHYTLWFERHALKLVCSAVVLGLAVYITGYYFGEGSAPADSPLQAVSALLMSLISTCRMFIMDSDLGDLGVMAQIPLYRVIFELILLLAFFFLILAAVASFGGTVLCRLRLAMLRAWGTRKPLYVLYGLSEDTLHLGESIRRREKKAVVILLHREQGEPDENRAVKRQALQRGFAVGTFRPERSTLKALQLPARRRPSRLFLLCLEKGWDGLETALSVCKALTAANADRSKIHLYVGLPPENVTLSLDLPVWEEWDIHWLDPEDQAARQLLSDRRFIRMIPKEGFRAGRLERRVHVAVLGYSRLAEALYSYLASCLQFPGGSVCVTALDEDIVRRTAPFRRMNPEFERLAAFETVDTALLGDGFFDYLEANAAGLDGIFCACPEDRDNLRLAQTLDSLCRREGIVIPVFFRQRELSPAAETLGKQFCSFGGRRELFTAELLVNETLDVMARAVHKYYGAFYGISEDEAASSWLRASLSDRRSSRALALSIPLKLYSLGYVLVPETEETALTGRTFEMTAQQAENLSIGEHLRWCVFMASTGWRRPEEWPPDRPKDSRRKLHACLAPWDTLPLIKKHYGVDYQYLDKNLICSLGKIVKDAGYLIAKEEEEGVCRS